MEILHHHETWEILGFLIVVALLVWKGVPGMLGKMLDKRAQVIAAELEEAKR
jgi:F-type H+-transporting ATPase subunit b